MSPFKSNSGHPLYLFFLASLYVSVSPSPPYLIGKLFQSFQVDVWLTKS